MLKDVLSVILFCGVGYGLIVGVAVLVKWLGPKLPQDPPTVCATARVIARREEKHALSTNYFLTFQLEDGERLEFSVAGEQYGLLVEGDQVDMTYQEKDKKLLDFQRL